MGRGLYSKVQTPGYTEEEEGQIGFDRKIPEYKVEIWSVHGHVWLPVQPGD